MVGNTKELSCISAITLDSPAICGGFVYKSVMQPPRIGKADSSCVVVPVRKACFANFGHLRYRLLMIQGSSFLVCIYILDGGLPYYIDVYRFYIG